MSKNNRDEKRKKIIKRRGASINREKTPTNTIKPNNFRVKTRKTQKVGYTGITPPKNIANQNIDEKISSKKRTLNNRLNSLEIRLKNVPQKFNSIDNGIQNIPNRITELRNNNYRSQNNLEKDYDTLNQKWSQVSNNIRIFSDQQTFSLLKGFLIIFSPSIEYVPVFCDIISSLMEKEIFLLRGVFWAFILRSFSTLSGRPIQRYVYCVLILGSNMIQLAGIFAGGFHLML